MNNESIMMPFVHRKSTKDSQISDIENSFSQQTRAWSKFNNRRNTSRIQHYFQVLHNKRITLSYNVAAVILCMIGIWVEALLINNFYTDSYQKQTQSILDIFYSTLYEHVIHTLRDPTFFSDFFPFYFGDPYKYPISEETAPIYASSFLIAYQFTEGYVTSWKAADITGTLVGLDFDESEPNVAFLQFCNGTNQLTYYWRSSISEFNTSFPLEGGTEFSSENVIKTDWFISGYNATGPLISELYIKRTNNNFIPLYTLVFPSINSKTHTTDFVFTFDLTLIKIQQFLRTLNVSRNSRLAVTTNENVLIAVTGDDQPIDAFNNEIVTKEISELGDPVWSCVSKDEAFIRHENFSTRCSITTFSEGNADDLSNITISYTVFRGTVSIGKVTTWQFIAAIENTIDIESPLASDIYPDKSPILKWDRNFIKPFIIGIVVFTVTCFILLVLYLFTPCIFQIIGRKNKSQNKYEKIEKQKDKITQKKSNTDILSSFGWKYSNHTKPIGLLNAISELNSLQESLYEDENTKSIAKKAIFEIRENSFGCPIFNEVDFFSRIDNTKVREKLKKMFGKSCCSYNFNENHNNSDNENLILDDQEIMRRRRSSISIQNSAIFDSPPLSNSVHHSKVHSISLNTYSKSSENSEKPENEFLALKNPSNLYDNNEESEPIQQVISIISRTNDYFNDPNFEDEIHKIFNRIPSELSFITTNSFFFIDGLIKLQSQLETTLFDRDMQLSLYIAELSYQDAINETRNQNEGAKSSQIIDKLFLKDDKLVFKCARSILFDLYKQHPINSLNTVNNSNNEVVTTNYNSESEEQNNNYDDNEVDSESYAPSESGSSKSYNIDFRWTKICEFTFEILKSTPLSSHMEVITKSQLFLTSNLTETKMTENESLILLKLLYITSMLSFLFEKNNSNIGCSLLGLNKKKGKDNENENNADACNVEDDIMGCLFENLIYPEMIALNQVFGSRYFRYYRSH